MDRQYPHAMRIVDRPARITHQHVGRKETGSIGHAIVEAVRHHETFARTYVLHPAEGAALFLREQRCANTYAREEGVRARCSAIRSCANPRRAAVNKQSRRGARECRPCRPSHRRAPVDPLSPADRRLPATRYRAVGARARPQHFFIRNVRMAQDAAQMLDRGVHRAFGGAKLQWHRHVGERSCRLRRKGRRATTIEGARLYGFTDHSGKPEYNPFVAGSLVNSPLELLGVQGDLHETTW